MEMHPNELNKTISILIHFFSVVKSIEIQIPNSGENSERKVRNQKPKSKA